MQSRAAPVLSSFLSTFLPTVALCGLLLQGCASSPDTLQDLPKRIDAWLPSDVILLGEQHDAPDHQHLQAAVVQELARRGQLAAVALEMVERGTSTRGLPPDALAEQVRTALRWNEAGWTWENYAPVVMAAVRSEITVVGANLERSAMRAAMGDVGLDGRLPDAAFALQRDAIRTGHCLLLPEDQLTPMTRIQVARDAAMAATLVDAARPGRTVLLVAGGGHVVRRLGVPAHLPATLKTTVVLAVAGVGDAKLRSGADVVWQTPPVPPQDHCAELERRLKR